MNKEEQGKTVGYVLLTAGLFTMLALALAGCTTPQYGTCKNYWCQRRDADACKIAGVLYWIENDVTNAYDKAIVTRVMGEHWKLIGEINKAVK